MHIDKQRSFFSTKKKRKVSVRIRKPTVAEKKSISKALETHSRLYGSKKEIPFTLQQHTGDKLPWQLTKCYINHARHAFMDMQARMHLIRTQGDLLSEFHEDVLDTPLPTALQHLFTKDTWMAVIQRGTLVIYNDTYCCQRKIGGVTNAPSSPQKKA